MNRLALETRLAPPVPADEVTVGPVTIGKDVLELVSSAMYVEPLTIYREYVQNAADAIDEARAAGLLSPQEPGRVEVTFDPRPGIRSIRIRDNGAALAWPEFTARLTSLGASRKRGTQSRGFRGVGRLAGLGFAQALVFRARAAGEALVSEMVWDCRALKAALRETTEDHGVETLIRQIVTVRQIDGEGYPDRFFEVELRGAVRQGADRLMSPPAVADYLAQVAPIPFAPEFSFGADITAALRPHVRLGELELWVGEDGPVYRPHRNTAPLSAVRSTTFSDLRLVEVPGVEGGVAAVAWFLHHDYEGALPNGAMVKGLRVRSGNIQIGDHALLEGLFSEPRFNVWSVGEVHVLDPRLIPNGRRDNFEQNVHLANLLNHLAPVTKEIAALCRSSSARRQVLRDAELQAAAARQQIAILAQGGLAAKARQQALRAGEQSVVRIEALSRSKALQAEDVSRLAGLHRKLRKELGAVTKTPAGASPLARLPKAKREMYEHLFDLIYESAVNRSAAKALIDRIILKVTAPRAASGRAPRRR